MFGLLTVLPVVAAALYYRRGEDAVRLRTGRRRYFDLGGISLPSNALVDDYRFLIQARCAVSLMAA